MALTSTHEFLNFGRGDNLIKNYYFGVSDNNREKKLFLCLAIKNRQPTGELMSENVFESGKEVFFQPGFESDYKRFEATLKEINSVLARFSADSITGDIGELHFVVGAIIDKTLHLSQVGEAEAYLIRHKHLSVISEGLTEEGKKNTFVNIASGEIENGDVLIFSSAKLLRHVTKNDLVKIFPPESDPEKDLLRLQNLIESETLDQIGVNIVKINAVPENGEKTKEKFAIQEIFSNFKNHSFFKRIREQGFFRQVEAKLFSGSQYEKNLRSKLSYLPNLFKKFQTGGEDQKRKTMLIGLGVVIFLLLTSIVFLKVNGGKQQLLDSYENTLAAVQEDIDKAYTLGITDKQKATEILTQAEEKTKEILQSGYLRGLASQRMDDIQSIKEKLDSIKKVSEPKLFADLTSAKSDLNSIGLVALANNLAAYEPQGVFEVILSKVETGKTIGGKEEIIDGHFFRDQNSAVFVSKSNKVIEYTEGRFQFMDTQDPAWKNSRDLKSFGNKIYLLDSTGNQIWKYQRSRENYGKAEAYFANTVDLSKALDFSIDGSVYLLNQDGSIRRFYGGVEEELAIRKAPLTPLKAPTAIYTEEEMTGLYVLEAAEKRVLVYNKEPRSGHLIYSHQLKFPTLGKIQDMLIDKASNKIYLLAENKIYEENL